MAKQALVAVLAAAWAVGLWHQLGSLPMTVGYIAISAVMIGIMFGNRHVFKFAPRRNNRRR